MFAGYVQIIAENIFGFDHCFYMAAYVYLYIVRIYFNTELLHSHNYVVRLTYHLL